MPIDHAGTKTIATPRLTLRRFDVSDTPDMFSNWACDALVAKYLTWKPYKTVEDVGRVIDETIERYPRSDFYHWAVVLNETGELIGSASAYDIHNKTARGEIGYVIGRRWWGRGFAPEVLDALLTFLFGEVGLECVYGQCDTDNVNSAKVMVIVGTSPSQDVYSLWLIIREPLELPWHTKMMIFLTKNNVSS